MRQEDGSVRSNEGEEEEKEGVDSADEQGDRVGDSADHSEEKDEFGNPLNGTYWCQRLIQATGMDLVNYKKTFSKSSIVTLYGKRTRELTFENFHRRARRGAPRGDSTGSRAGKVAERRALIGKRRGEEEADWKERGV